MIISWEFIVYLPSCLCLVRAKMSIVASSRRMCVQCSFSSQTKNVHFCKMGGPGMKLNLGHGIRVSAIVMCHKKKITWHVWRSDYSVDDVLWIDFSSAILNEAFRSPDYKIYFLVLFYAQSVPDQSPVLNAAPARIGPAFGQAYQTKQKKKS